MAARKSPTKINWGQRLGAYRAPDIELFDSAFLNHWGNRIWNPNDADKRAAAQLHIQISSRVATQPLGYLEGVEIAALESIFQLFNTARTAAEQNFGAAHFELLTWHVLNTFVRPFTSRWHAESKRGGLFALDATDEFRAELRTLQHILVLFDELLLDIRDGARPLPTPPQREATSPLETEMAKPLRSEIWSIHGVMDAKLVNRINVAERSAIEGRRATYNLPKDKTHTVGLALSGGGIRSATFSLGVLTALARRNLLPQFDYLSTVSGGGYLGSFLTAFLSTSAPSGAKIGLASTQLPFSREDGEADAIQYIRHRSKYLHTSTWERVKFAIAQTYGMLVNNLALALLPAAVGLAEYLLRPSIDAALSPLDLKEWVTLALLVVAVMVPFCVRFIWGARRYADGVLAILAMVLVVLLSWNALAIVHKAIIVSANGVGFTNQSGAILALLGGVPLVASAFVAVLGRKFPRSQKLLTVAAGLSIPFFFLAVELATYQWLAGDNIHVPFVADEVPRWLFLFVVIIVFGAITFSALDINFTAPHRHYRRKLAETFLIRPATNPTTDRPFETSLLLPLSEAAKSKKGPYHLLNCALNVPGSRNPAIQGRLTDFFVFSSAFSGSPLTGYFSTESWEQADQNLNLAAAMAISGAATSPLMGLSTARYSRFWLALLNFRLGYWVRKPSPPVRVYGDAPGLRFLLRELMGWIDERERYLNVTDGGHVENLGVYELLRRRCKFIVAVDGEHDASMTFHALTNLQRLAAIDLGVTIEVDLSDLRLGEKGLSRSHFQFCRIRYPSKPAEEPAIGYLLYLKLSLTGNEGEFLRRYRLDEPAFPHHPTANQFFSEIQFEAYRALGEHIGDKLFLRAIVGDLSKSTALTLEDWFAAIGKSMLRPIKT